VSIPLRYLTVERGDVDLVEQPIKRQMKQQCGLPCTFPDGVWYGSKEAGMMGQVRWWDKLMCEKLVLLLMGGWASK
jgi:hypothetical protein